MSPVLYLTLKHRSIIHQCKNSDQRPCYSFFPSPISTHEKSPGSKSFLWKAFNHTLIHVVERKKAMWKMYTALLGKFDFRKIRQATYSNVLVQITAVLCILLLMLWKVTEKALGELHSSIWQSTACISRAADNKCQPHFLSRLASCRPESIHLFQTTFMLQPTQGILDFIPKHTSHLDGWLLQGWKSVRMGS